MNTLTRAWFLSVRKSSSGLETFYIPTSVSYDRFVNQWRLQSPLKYYCRFAHQWPLQLAKKQAKNVKNNIKGFLSILRRLVDKLSSVHITHYLSHVKRPQFILRALLMLQIWIKQEYPTSQWTCLFRILTEVVKGITI